MEKKKEKSLNIINSGSEAGLPAFLNIGLACWPFSL